MHDLTVHVLKLFGLGWSHASRHDLVTVESASAVSPVATCAVLSSVSDRWLLGLAEVKRAYEIVVLQLRSLRERRLMLLNGTLKLLHGRLEVYVATWIRTEAPPLAAERVTVGPVLGRDVGVSGDAVADRRPIRAASLILSLSRNELLFAILNFLEDQILLGFYVAVSVRVDHGVLDCLRIQVPLLRWEGRLVFVNHVILVASAARSSLLKEVRTVLALTSQVLLLECLVVDGANGLLLVVSRSLELFAAHIHDLEGAAQGAVFAHRITRQ